MGLLIMNHDVIKKTKRDANKLIAENPPLQINLNAEKGLVFGQFL